MMTDRGAAEWAVRYLGELSPSAGGIAVTAADGRVLAGRASEQPPRPGLVQVVAQVDWGEVRAWAPAGPLAELARVDAQAAAAVVRERC